MINCSEARVGDILEIEKDLYKVVERQHVKPGKGGAFYQFELKKLQGGQKKEMKIRVEESLKKVDLFNRKGIFLYSNKDFYTFFDPETQEQFEFQGSSISNINFLEENMEVQMFFANNETLLEVQLPKKVHAMVEAAPGYIKGQSVSSQDKIITLQNGAKIKAPQYVVVGDRVEVNLEDLSFVKRV